MLTADAPRHLRRGLGTGSLAILGLMLLAVALRMWIVYEANQRLPDSPERLTGDETNYDRIAYGLLQGSIFESPTRTPVYPLFLAACYAIFGHSYAAALYVQAVVGATAVPLTYLLARRFTGTRSALAAGLLMLFLSIGYYWVTYLYSEELFTPLLLLAVMALLRALGAPVIERFMLAGALFAVAALCRPATALFPLLLPVLLPRAWALRRRVILWAAFVGMMIAMIAPWTYHNYRLHHRLVPLAVPAAVYWQASPEYYRLLQEKSTERIWREELNPAVNGGYDPFEIAGSDYFTARALASIQAEPLVYARFCLEKVAYFWIGQPAEDWGLDFLRFDILRTRLSALEFAATALGRLLPLAALVALVVLRRRLGEFAPLLAVCGYFTVTHALTNAELRYSEPLHPYLTTFVVSAASEVARRHGLSPRRAAPAGNVRDV
jgi:hypothetical protein